MSHIPSISEAEWEVMTIVWSSNPITATEVVDQLAGKKNWNPRTVKTLLNRLVKKRALAFDVDGKRYLYRPRVQQHECVMHESRSFLGRVFGGDAAAMLVRFVDEVELTPDEIAQLKRAIDKKRR